MKQRRGFTIVELIIVIVVIGILASITVVSFVTVQRQARDQKRHTDILIVKKALKRYYDDNGEYPLTCGYGIACPLSNISSALTPKYLSEIPTNPLGAPYQYVAHTNSTTGVASYAIRIIPEFGDACKTGVNVLSGWWITTPTCDSSWS
jgi:general secretion pathway protein G